MISDVEQLFMSLLLTICVSFLEKCLAKIFAHSKTESLVKLQELFIYSGL